MKVLFGFFLCVFAISAFTFVSALMEYRKGEDIYHSLAESVIITPAETEQKTESQADQEQGETENATQWLPPQINFEELQKMNQDIVGWIAVENTTISYPLLQGSDNQYYTEMTADLKKNKAGSIFLDFRNNDELTDKHSVIYGHALKNEAMFGTLKNFLNQDYVNTHQKFYIMTPEKTMVYEIVSAYQTTAGSKSYLINFTKGTSFNQYIALIKNASVIHSETEITNADKIMTLSTCTNANEEDRYVVHGKLIAEEEK